MAAQSPLTTARQPLKAENKPLAGVTICDFTWAGVGAYSTFLLSMLGASVIKIESQSISVGTGGSGRTSNPVRRRGVTVSLFEELNAGKKSVALNLKHARGRELALGLVAGSNLVMENFRPGVMKRLGLGYDDLKVVRPDLVMVSMSTSGGFGPESLGTGYAPVFAALSGASWLTGYKDGPPVELRFPVDMESGTMGTFSALMGLYRQETLREGSYFDLSNRETFGAFIADAFMDYAWNGREQGRVGNQDWRMAPHDCYPCAGEDEWIVIAVESETEWDGLKRALGNPAWMEDASFADRFLRWKNSDALDQKLGDWTKDRSAREIMELLQSFGVASTPSHSAMGLLTDTHLNALGKFKGLSKRDGNSWIFFGPPWTLTGSTVEVTEPSPELGQHSREVLTSRLGLSDDEFDELVEQRAIH
ncbi:MAG: hypothetical protein GEU28_05950 [Dehalococcoidia bacterium]|nr:hypothetical protein [Dehalococcoidia bacterium]